MSQSVLITGANRGIGLALAHVYQARGWTVIATCRSASPELDQLGAQVIADIDVAEPAAVARLQEALDGRHLDVLINNAGILSGESLDSMDYAAIERQFQINALAPLRVVETLLPNLQAGSKVALVTSRMGSIADNGSGGYYGYRMSKAALNAAGVSLARDLQPRGIAVALLHPGMVKTAMTGGHGDVTPQQAAEGLVHRIDELNVDNSGTFWHAKGEVLPW
ncbi:SDR family oxidoreductase [Exilibacterium tricleocarpae]|uniref:SDR family oxidoreductase n=1 Tax=Exilibacterium tricleocarpae TaxID=2591008 RepID=A0A545T642_9GAMM|nr:SDR family oxidoreductase [Exilibacterium tricleocarpae]TQV72696.1 SDR family oxidoreductase [Exilibacterium tricleocarpae]